MAEKRKIAAFVAVHNADGAILMGQNVDGQWCAPGGKAEKDESPEEAAARELREEAGIGVETMGYLGAGRGQGTFDVYVFKATVDNVAPNADGDPDEEFKDFRWVKQDELKDLDLKYGDHDVVLGILGWGPRQPDAGERSEDFDPETSAGLAKAVNLRKSLGDIKPGKRMKSGRIDYSHVLSPAQQEKYKILIEERPVVTPGVVAYGAGIYHRGTGKEIGAVRGTRRLDEEAGKRYAVLNFSSVDPEHRGQGLGKPAYEAFLAHARHQGATHVSGDEHSTNASKVHTWLSGKHGLDYKPQPNPTYSDAHHGLQQAFNNGSKADDGNWDFKKAPYEYMLKAEEVFTRGPHNDVLWNGTDNSVKAALDYIAKNGGDAQSVSSNSATRFMERPEISDDTKADFLRVMGHKQAFSKPLKPEIVDNMVRRSTGPDGKLNNIAAESLENIARKPDAMSANSVKALVNASRNSKEFVMADERLMAKMPTADASRIIDDHMAQYPTVPQRQMWSANNVAPETMAKIGEHIQGTIRPQHPNLPPTSSTDVNQFLAHQGVPADAKAKMWDRLKAHHLQHQYMGNSGVSADMAKKWVSENPDVFKENNQSLFGLASNPHLGEDFWAPHFKPGGAVDQHLQAGHHLPAAIFDKVPHAEAWKDLGELPLRGTGPHGEGANFPIKRFVDRAPDEAVADFHRRGLVKPWEAGVEDRLYEMGAGKQKLLNVRTGTDKLRAIRDSLEAGPKHVQQLRAEGMDPAAHGLNRHLDPKGMLSAQAVQSAIDAKPARQYGHESGKWTDAQRHSKAASKVFQLTLPPETLREIRKQGLRPAYDKLLASSVGHPRHDTRGAGWARYTESPDGVHIDEIQTDFGHNMYGHIKNLDESRASGNISAAQREKLPTTEEYSRLNQLMWGNEHPSKVIHEAFMEKLRGQKKVGKEVHQWQLAPKMELADQSPNKPPPVHMKQTYDEFPQKAGYKPSAYGRLKTQNSAAGNQLNGQPTWATNVRKDEGNGRTSDLVAVHNLTPQNLQHAHKLGGLSVPSIAITHRDHVPDSFGDISLVAHPSMIDPKKGAPTYNADVYSPRHPRGEFKVKEKAMTKLNAMLRPHAEATGAYTGDLDESIKKGDLTHDSVRHRAWPAFAHAFLASKGQEPDIPTKPVYSRHADILDTPAMQNFKATFGTSKWGWPDDDAHPDYQKHFGTALRQAAVEADAKLGLALDDPDKNIHQEGYGGNWFEPDGTVSHNAANIVKDLHRHGEKEVDKEAMRDQLEHAVKQHPDFEPWMENQIAPTRGNQVFRPPNRTRTVPYTLDNLVNHMSGNIKQGEGFNYGLGSARAAGAHKFSDINEIRNSAYQLTDHEGMEAHKKQQNEEYGKLEDAMQRYQGTYERSSMLMDAIGDSFKPGKNLPKALKENGYVNVPPDMMQKLMDFRHNLHNSPTEYFESKPQRAVGLSEFKGAAVPHDVDPHTLGILKGLGLPVVHYDRNDPKARSQAVQKIADSQKLHLSEADFVVALDKSGIAEPQTWAQKFELDLDFWLSDNGQMLEKGMRHVLWGLAAATALTAAPSAVKAPKPEAPQMSVEPANQSVQPPVQASMMPPKSIQPWNPKGLRDEMIPIAHLESSFGKNMQHEAHSGGDFKTAYGAVGFKPETAHETYQKSKALQAVYPNLGDPQAFTAEFKANPEMYNAVASKHFGNLMSTLGTPEKAAFAWRWGIGAAQNASDADVAADPYVTKYKALASARAERMKAAIEAQFPKAQQ